MIGKYKVAHLIGSTDGREKQFRHAEKVLTEQGYICFTPVIYIYDQYIQYKDMIDNMCTAKFNVCDIIVIVTPEHIGKSTSSMIMDAFNKNIPIYKFAHDRLEVFDMNLFL